MTEEFLHHIWKFRLFDQLNLQTVAGEQVIIEKVGDYNSDAGPDFFNAKIKIAETLWVGNVEVHINASDWKKHKHQIDKNYDNIILHVVANADGHLYRSSGGEIPTLEIKNRIGKKLYQNYLNFKSHSNWIPCEKQITAVPPLIVNNTIDKLVLERLERKSEAIINMLKLTKNNWEQTFYQHLARNFGFKTNAEPFELIAKNTPLITLAKHKNSLLQIEAILFGQAGFLEEYFQDSYLQLLQNEYVFLKQKFGLVSIEKNLWKFLRLRPANFPTIRLAQFSSLVFQSSHLFSKIIETEKYDELLKLFDVTVSDYWNTHYLFDKPTVNKKKNLGESAIKNIVINTIVPFLFVYGKQKNDDKYIARALLFLEQIEGESNAIVNKWKRLHLPVKTAYSTQALLQLKNEYCNHKKCLNCSIGAYLLKNA